MVGMNRPTSPDLTQSLQVAVQACDGARAILNSHYGHLHQVSEKFQAGLVSEADRNSENFIVDLIKNSFPGDAILGEETGLNSSSRSENSKPNGRLWMIDPLDGTTNYIHGFPFFCISIGLEVDGELVLGVVDAPKLGMRFRAVKGGGAFLNDQPIKVSDRSRLEDGLFATGFSSYDHTLDEQLEFVSFIVKKTRGIRRAGSAALDLCFVANGVFDVFWEKQLQPWDTAAGTIIAREAGAIVTDIEGKHFEPNMKSILCGSPALHSESLNIWKRISQN
jgi:myo-inositol-1(or 4)-monophosphatase